MAIDYEQARALLNSSYEKAAQELPSSVSQYIADNETALDTIFSSKTQSYRGALLGCAVARYLDMASTITPSPISPSRSSISRNGGPKCAAILIQVGRSSSDVMIPSFSMLRSIHFANL